MPLRKHQSVRGVPWLHCYVMPMQEALHSTGVQFEAQGSYSRSATRRQSHSFMYAASGSVPAWTPSSVHRSGPAPPCSPATSIRSM